MGVCESDWKVRARFFKRLEARVLSMCELSKLRESKTHHRAPLAFADKNHAFFLVCAAAHNVIPFADAFLIIVRRSFVARG